ncbi:tetratricopeptide repeat protein [Pelagicoccus sp. SDUM812002]|uniref:tetratricopeptide repeat protein n=1 Tax=Pelagicoccus sp. SDUM812002 TaxID=3041266 RepID=UPI00280CCB82|nr:tetratricopeptide repeat protein [Pelagicoccus sp. SDUM812002]MDQ8187488.1 tetratricopeptide repeat protein [Pelagicoccus sp. SDUM812002]
MSSPNLERAQLLLEQNRGKDAEEYARLAIQENPDDALGYLYLSTAFLQQNKDRDALDPAERCLSLDPDNPHMHAHLARVHYHLQDWKKAEASAKQALQMNPEDSDMFGLLAYLAARKADWEKSLSLAENGLQFDSDHILCTNARANALSKLKRVDDAQDSLDYALKRNPENPYTHYQKGNTLLEAGKYEEAAKHFCEALRLAPNFEEAKEGLVEALKARHFVYSLFLKYIFFMTRLKPGMQMAIIFGGFFAQRIIASSLAASGQYGAATAVRVLYGAFAYFTWTASSLFNLLLFIHPMGRFALSERQRKVASGVGACVILIVASLTIHVTTGIEGTLFSALAFAATSLPISAAERVSSPKKFKLLGVIIVAQSICALGAFALYLAGNPDTADGPASLAVLTGVAFTWLSSFFRN